MSDGAAGTDVPETDPGSLEDERRDVPATQGSLVQTLAGLIVPLGAVLAALFVGALMLWALDANPWDGYKALFSGAFGGSDQLADTAIKSMPRRK